MDYLSDKYGSLLHYDNALCFSIADRSFSGVENRSYYVYDRSDEPVQSILNYNLSFSKFAPDDNGDLLCIWLNNPLCVSEYLGDYPIISVDEATEQLMNGKYFSSVPGAYIRNGRISKEGIAKIELGRFDKSLDSVPRIRMQQRDNIRSFQNGKPRTDGVGCHSHFVC